MVEEFCSFLLIGFKVAQLFVGVSNLESVSNLAELELGLAVMLKLLGAQLCPLPLKSLPNVVAVLPELSEK